MSSKERPVVGWGIVGCGAIARTASAPAITKLPDCRLVAVMDLDTQQVQEFAQDFRVPRWYTDLSEFLKDPDLEAIHVATPPHVHAQQSIAAAEAGKHVLCEKPMAIKPDKCLQMMDACSANGVILGVAYYRRLFPQVIKLRELVDSGVLGEILALRAHYSSYHAKLGDPGDWRTDPKIAGGGVLMDTGSHRIDLLVYFGGKPSQVAAFCDTRTPDWQVEDLASLIIRFQNGVHATLQNTFCSQARADIFEIHGTQGWASVNPLSGDTVVIMDSSGERQEKVHPLGKPDRQLPLIEDFSKAVMEARPPICPGSEGLKTTQILDAVYRSSQRGELVSIP